MTAIELRSRLEQYLALRHALGFALHTASHLLYAFVNWLEAQDFTSTISARQAIDWACLPPYSDRPGTSSRRLSAIRGFLIYLRASEPATEIPGQGLLASPLRPVAQLWFAHRGGDKAAPCRCPG